MPINTEELVSYISELVRESDLKVCIRQSVRRGIITGAGTTFGGILFGPVGTVVGALLGLVTATSTGENFRSVADILINDLTPAQRALLVNRVNNVIRGIEPSDVLQLTVLLASNANVRNSVLNAVRDFVQRDLSLQIM